MFHRLIPAALLAATALGTTIAAAKEDAAVDPQSLAGSYLAARVAVTDRDTDNAVKLYERALQLDPDNLRLKQDAFLTYITNGDLDAAVKLGRTLPLDEDAPGILRLTLAVDALRSKDLAAAARGLDREWNAPLDRLLAGLMRSWAEFGQGDVDKALNIIDELDGPTWYDLFVDYHSGLVALAANRHDDAIERLENAANGGARQGAPRTFPAIVRALAVARASAGDFDAAIEAVEEENAQQPSVLYEKVLEALRQKKVPAFDIRDSQRGAAEAMLNVGAAINRQGGLQFAALYFQLAKALAPTSDRVSLMLAEYYDRAEALERANEQFAAIPETSAFSRIARLERALNLDELGKLEPAREVMDALLEERPGDLVTTLSYGAVLARHEKFDEAAKVYEAAIAEIDEPQAYHWNLFYRVGIAYERTKRWPQAEAAFRRALELYPNEPRVLNYLGYSWVDMDRNLEEGLKMIETAVSLRPRDGYIVDSLGWAFYRLGRYGDAVRELERAVELRPADPTINDHLGDALWRDGRKLEAIYQWGRALTLDAEPDQEQIIRDKIRNGLPPKIETLADPAKPDEKPKKKT